jgi:hypothetical protein
MLLEHCRCLFGPPSLDGYDLSLHLVHISQGTNHISPETFDLSLDLSPNQNYHVFFRLKFWIPFDLSREIFHLSLDTIDLSLHRNHMSRETNQMSQEINQISLYHQLRFN